MNHLSVVNITHLPLDFAVYVALYRDLENASFLRQQLLDGNADFEYALLDASVVLSERQLSIAIFRAVNDLAHKRMKSRNVHSEIVFAFSPNNNIAESFRRFGITDATKDLIVVKLEKAAETNAERVYGHLEKSIKGTMTSFSDSNLLETADLAKIKKIYKLNKATGGSKSAVKPSDPAGDDVESQAHERYKIEMAILGQMALRGIS